MASIFDQLREQSQTVVDRIYGMKLASSRESIVTYTAPWVRCFSNDSISIFSTVTFIKGMQGCISILVDVGEGPYNEVSVS